MPKAIPIIAIILLIIPSVSGAYGIQHESGTQYSGNSVILQLQNSPGLTINITKNISVSLKVFGLGFIGPGGTVYGSTFADSNWAVSRISQNQVEYRTQLNLRVVNEMELCNISQYLPVNLSNITSLESSIPGLRSILNMQGLPFNLSLAKQIPVNVYVNLTRSGVSGNYSVSVYQNNLLQNSYPGQNYSLFGLNYSYNFPSQAPPGFLFLIQYVHGIFNFRYAEYNRVAVRYQPDHIMHNGIELYFNMRSSASAFFWWNETYSADNRLQSLYNFTDNLGFGRQSVIFFYNMTSTTHALSEDPYFMIPAVDIGPNQISVPKTVSQAVNFLVQHLFLLLAGTGFAGLLLLAGYGVYRRRGIA